jgi:hypothetical protein
MSGRLRGWSLACALACLAVAGGAQAQQLGFYVGGYYGQSDRDGEIAPFDAFADQLYDFVGFNALQTTSRIDGKDNGFGFTAGYRLFENLAFEGGYMDLGGQQYRATATGAFNNSPPSGLTVNLDSEVSGIALSALGVLPLSYRSEIYGRLGLLFSTTDLNIFVSDGVDALRDSFSESSTDYLVGVGGGLSFAEVYTLRLEFTRVFGAGSEDAGGDEDVDMLSLGFIVAF